MPDYTGVHVRIDLVGSISAHHVHDRFVAARMVLEPCIRLQYLVFDNDNASPICNQAFNLPPRQDGLFTRLWSCESAYHGHDAGEGVEACVR